jgi:hypothetical protein
MNDCIRCGEAPRVVEDGYCAHCYWAVRAEIADGLYQFGSYLDAWLRFAEWCDVHDAAA